MDHATLPEKRALHRLAREMGGEDHDGPDLQAQNAAYFLGSATTTNERRRRPLVTMIVDTERG